jgi:hypothetical protein
MDPNATLAMIADLLRQSAHDDIAGYELDIACQDLYDWLTAGGFEPDWSRHETAAGYYRCRAVSHRRGVRVESEEWR